VLAGLEAPQSSVGEAMRIDAFEEWCLTRERRTDNLQAARYVSPETIGYEDLDVNGTWQVVTEYGPVWMPRVGAEWVPYRFGRWAWVDPWGWTWIDDAPWGFAPFHYGRWAFLPRRGWAWIPGSLNARPVYAPALVAFVGGAHWNASVNLGTSPIGWFPLGPREVYVPAYRVTPEYLQRVNVAQVTNINLTNIDVTNITYVNRAVPGAVTAVPRERFAQGRPLGTTAVAIAREQAQAAQIVATAAVAPQRASIGSSRHSTATPPAAAVTRQVVVRSAPPPAPTPFAAKQSVLAQHPGQPLDASTENASRVQTSQAAPTHPLVRAVVSPRPARGGSPAAVPSTAPARGAVPTATPQVPPPTPVAPSNPPAPSTAGQERQPTPQAPTATAAPPRPSPPNAGAPRPASPQTGPDLATRHAHERAEIDARQAQERAALHAKHEQELQATKGPQRAQMQIRHQQETKALQDRQKQEREAMQQRQLEERQKKGPESR